MSQPNQTSKSTTPSRPGSGCVPPSQHIKISSTSMDEMLLGAWNSLPDAEPAPAPVKPAPISIAQQAFSRNVPQPTPPQRPVAVRQSAPPPSASRPSPAPSAEQEQRFVAPPIPNPTPAQKEARTIAPPTPVPANRTAPAPAKSFTPPPPSFTPPTASPPRPPVTFSRPRSSSSSLSLNMDEVRKWGTALVGIVVVSLAGYWGVSNVLGNSAPPLKTLPIKGTVTLNGKPAPGASVQLHPAEGSSAPVEVHPRGQVSESGQVEFTTFTPNDGVPAGEYIATISHMKVKVVNGETVAGPQLAPAIFTKPATSPVRVTVSQESKDPLALDFKKPAR